MLRKMIITMTVFVLAVFAGCESHSQGKKAAKVAFDKSSASIRLTVAQQQYSDGEYGQSLKTVRQCLETDPNNIGACLLYGKLLLANGQRETAVDKLIYALKLDDRLTEAWYWLGVAAQQEQKYSNAHLYYQQALLLDPTNVDYILSVAMAQVAQDKVEEALTLLTEKMAACPQEVSLKIAAADLMSRLGRYEQAQGLYKHSMLLTNDDSDVAQALGYCYMFDGKWNEAAEVFGALVEHSADEQEKGRYLHVTALCSMNSAQYDKAIDYYNQLSSQQSDDAELWLNLGQAALGSGAVHRALRCGQKAISLRTGYSDAIVLVGCAQYADSDYAAAVRTFERISSDKKTGGFSWMMRARCYEKLGQRDEAERAYKKAFELNPNSKLANFLAKGRDNR